MLVPNHRVCEFSLDGKNGASESSLSIRTCDRMAKQGIWAETKIFGPDLKV